MTPRRPIQVQSAQSWAHWAVVYRIVDRLTADVVGRLSLPDTAFSPVEDRDEIVSGIALWLEHAQSGQGQAT